MYAASEDEMDVAINNILKEKVSYPEFVKRFEAFYKRKTEWVLYFRNDLLTRQHNTNNLAEISIRILKDIVLCRTKAFNVVALCEFCIAVWEMYLVKRLLDYAYGRRNAVFILSSNLLKKSTKFSQNDIQEINADTFHIKSGKYIYTVNVNIGACSCPAGMSGAFCKHQCFIMNLKNIVFPNSPPIFQEDRYNLGLLALGSKCPEESFFNNFEINVREKENETYTSIPNSQPESFVTNEENSNSFIASPAINDAQKQVLSEEFRRLSNLTHQMTSESAQKLINSIKKIKTIEDLTNTFILKSIAPKSKKIKVQPTSVARRKGLVKSSKKLPSGRPPLSTIKKNVKRKRQLSENVKNNVQNAKSHGIAH